MWEGFPNTWLSILYKNGRSGDLDKQRAMADFNDNIQALRERLDDEASFITILQLMAFSKNGYIREYALRGIVAINDINAIPFLLLGTNDWVPDIHKFARKTQHPTSESISFFLAICRSLDPSQQVSSSGLG
jgi:hypothetical protein